MSIYMGTRELWHFTLPLLFTLRFRIKPEAALLSTDPD
jgi:hypothetical protein